MKLRTRLLSVLLMLTTLLSLFSAWAVSAAKDESGSLDTRTQKIVTVVYDTSGSMMPNFVGPGVDELRIEGAEYALSMLVASLDERDEMYLVPMSNFTYYQSWGKVVCEKDGDEIPIDLSAKDRNSQIKNILSRISGNYSSSTPIMSVNEAVKVLASKGLKNKDQLNKSDPNKEFWLIVLTDGQFTDDKGNDLGDASGQAKAIAAAVKNYPTLRTAYVSFGSTSTDISEQKTIKDNHMIDAYCKVTPKPAKGEQGLVDVISKIASDISGRYPLDSKLYDVDGSKVVIDISSLGFSLSSLSVVAQNCGAVIKDNGISYSGSSKVSVANKCVITPHQKLGLKAGCTFKVLASPSMLGGKLTLEFDGTVSEEDLVIYAEPALSITSYIEAKINGEWVRVTPADINGSMDAGEKIRVGYEVVEQVNNSPVKLEDYFDDVTTKVIYAGDEHKMNKEFPLIEGTHDLSIEVSVLGGNYTLRDSDILTVYKDHNAFRVEPQDGHSEVEGSSPTAKATFTVIVDEKAATKSILDGYKLTLVITRASTGEILSEKEVKAESDGKIVGSYQLETNDFDEIIFDLTAVSPEGMEREGRHTVTYVPSGFEISIEGEKGLSITQYELIVNGDEGGDTYKALTFKLTANGKDFPFNNSVSTYKLEVDGIDVTEFAEVTGSTLTYVPKDAEKLSKISGKPGAYKVVLSTKSDKPSLNTKNEEASVTIIKTEFAVVPVDTPNKKINRFDLSHCDASLAFTVTRDNIPLTAEELKAVQDKLKVKTTPFFTFFIFPAGMEKNIEELDENTGALIIKAKKDMPRYFEWHFAAFITGSNKTVTVTYGDVSGTDHFEMIKSNPLVHIFRIICLILAIAIAVYLTIYIIGFIVAKPLPYGIFIKSGVKGASEVTFINESIFTIVLWHLKRFISPTKLLADQPIGDQPPWCDNMEFVHHKGKIEMTPSADNCIYKVDINPAYTNTMTQFIKSCENDTGKKLSDFMKEGKIKSADQIFTVALDNASIPMTAKKTMSKGAYYGCYSKKAKKLSMTYVVGFRPLSRNK